MEPAGLAASAPNWAQMEIFVRVSSLRLALTWIMSGASSGTDIDCVTTLEVGFDPVVSQTTSDMPDVVNVGTAVSLAPAR